MGKHERVEPRVLCVEGVRGEFGHGECYDRSSSAVIPGGPGRVPGAGGGSGCRERVHKAMGIEPALAPPTCVLAVLEQWRAVVAAAAPSRTPVLIAVTSGRRNRNQRLE
jgi:hypothetical protein